MHELCHENIRESPELLLPFSHSHLLFRVTLGPLPADGLGVDRPSSQFDLEVLSPRGVGEPNDERFALASPPTALLNKGLALVELGENGDPLGVPGAGLPLPDNGDGT
jgi:hypothetical protein